MPNTHFVRSLLTFFLAVIATLILLPVNIAQADGPVKPNPPAKATTPAANSSCNNPIRIMPLGDSITRGNLAGAGDASQEIAYRKDLWDQLQSDDYSLNFVGSATNGQFYENEGFDPHHEGHSGWRADEIAFNILDTGNGGSDWLTNNPADIVLLHIGTNDILQSQTITSTVDDIALILDKIESYDENITVVVAQIINMRPSASNASERLKISQLNEAIAGLVNNRIANGDNLVLVDMENDADLIYQLIPTGDMNDNVHPFATGFTKKANLWASSLENIIALCNTPPHINSTPPVTVTQAEAYSYQVTATGVSTLTFSLETAPAGMTIDATTGLIIWYPIVSGRVSVTVMATNSFGVDRQEFAIEVAAAPICLSTLTNYWHLDETNATLFSDQIGLVNATCAGACPATAPGIIGNGQVFDGNTTSLNVAPNADFDWAANDSFSIAYWVKGVPGQACNASNQVIVGRHENSFNPHWWLGCESGTGNATVVFSDTDDDDDQLLLSGPSITDGNWHYVTFVRNGATNLNSLYVDGLLASSQTRAFSANFASVNEDINIGWLDFPGNGFHFQGTVDELAIFDTALSADEVLQYHAAGQNQHGYCGFYAPKIISVPLLQAAENVEYGYNVNAYGYPAPIYSLLSGPDGMSINPTTGLISWLPTLGLHSVTVQAANANSIDSQMFNLAVGTELVCLPSIQTYWSLNESEGPTYSDLLNQTNAQCASNCPTAATGVAGRGQRFNGSDAGINVPANSRFSWAANDSFSIELWMKAIPNQTCADSNEVFIGRDDTTTNLHWWLGCIADSGALTVVFNDTDADSDQLVMSGQTVTDGSWHHIVFTRNGNTGQNNLYVDGVLNSTKAQTFSAGFTANIKALNIGWLDFPSNGFHFQGWLDEVALYNGVLTPQSIREHYQQSLILGQNYCTPFDSTAIKPIYAPIIAK